MFDAEYHEEYLDIMDLELTNEEIKSAWREFPAEHDDYDFYEDIRDNGSERYGGFDDDDWW